MTEAAIQAALAAAGYAGSLPTSEAAAAVITAFIRALPVPLRLPGDAGLLTGHILEALTAAIEKASSK
jgi:hypothetical protein